MKQGTKKKPMEKAIYVKAPKEFVEMLNEAQWHLKMRPSEIVRKAVVEYLERHLPKEIREKILRKHDNKKP
jgi:sugar-specific transcriptional regulator TrmB